MGDVHDDDDDEGSFMGAALFRGASPWTLAAVDALAAAAAGGGTCRGSRPIQIYALHSPPAHHFTDSESDVETVPPPPAPTASPRKPKAKAKPNAKPKIGRGRGGQGGTKGTPPRRRRRFRPGKKALAEIRQYQKSTALVGGCDV